MSNTNTLSGYDAIAHAEANGLTLSKYADPVDGARDGLTVAEARSIASEDQSLIYLVPNIKINVYQVADGTWFGARWIDGEYDGCDELEISSSSTVEDAIAHAESMPLTVNGARVVKVVDDNSVSN